MSDDQIAVYIHLREENMLRKKKITSSQKKRAAAKTKGQSTVEYIILVAAVIAAMIIFSGTFKSSIQSTFTSGTNGMQNMADRLQASRP